MHKGKTKFMTNYDTNSTITVEGHSIEKVEEYKYLGQTLKMKDCTHEEVMKRIKSGWSCFGRHKEILCDKKIPMTWRRKIFDQCVLPTMTYGAETWTTTKKTRKATTNNTEGNGKKNATFIHPRQSKMQCYQRENRS